MREKERLVSQGLLADVKTIAKNLKVSEKSVVEMDQRLASSGAEISIDQGPSEMSETSFHEILPAPGEEIDEQLAFSQGLEILKDHLGNFLQGLNARDREVFEKRLLSEIPSSLQSIADEYGVSRERIRQVEVRLLEKLKVYMSDYLR
jgi:RNA polymerase sigma-32 factor